MSQITVEEPKSIVEEVDKYQCDCGCGRIDSEEQFVVQEMRPLTDTTDRSQASTAHIHKECAKHDKWVDYMQTRERRESLVNIFGRRLKETAIYVTPFFVSICISATTVPIQASLISNDTTGEAIFVAGIESIVLSILLLIPLSIALATLDFMTTYIPSFEK